MCTYKKCTWYTIRESKSEDAESTSGGASSLMWNAVGGEMEEEMVNAVKVRCDQDDVSGVAAVGGEMEEELVNVVKVRCDQDDVSGVALDIRGRELERELEKIMLDDGNDESGDDKSEVMQIFARSSTTG